MEAPDCWECSTGSQLTQAFPREDGCPGEKGCSLKFLPSRQAAVVLGVNEYMWGVGVGDGSGR